VRQGKLDPDHISTSYVERQNLTMRMQMRRLTRLTNAFSKKVENLKATVALHFAWYNFVRVHRSLRVAPAMEAHEYGLRKYRPTKNYPHGTRDGVWKLLSRSPRCRPPS
jgi:hypothetical protein